MSRPTSSDLPAALPTLERRDFLRHGLAVGAVALTGSALRTSPNESVVAGAPGAHAPPALAPFELEEATITELQSAMAGGRFSARSITQMYLERIHDVDRTGPAVNAVLELNPEALSIADSLDAERKAGTVRGRLHGIPVLIKDNIDTADRMHTSAGSLALAESRALADAEIVRRLRAAGAIILGKTNLSEWANWRSTRSSSGWSGRGGQTRNPYALDRNPCGSSSGTGAGISANLAAVGIGTETDGSIVCPSSVNGLVGIKPTVGLVSRSGIIPISHSQDTAGPMCRTVRDAAILLSIVAGADARDAATARSAGHVERDYTSFCDAAGLKGARIGVVRQLFNAGPATNRVMEEVMLAMKDAGAILVDPVEMKSIGHFEEAEFEVLLVESKSDIAAYLATLGPSAPYKSLTDLIRFNDEHAAASMPYFGQEIFLQAEAKGTLASPTYRRALATCQRLSRSEGIDLALRKFRLDALIAPTGGPAWMTDLVTGDHFTGGSSALSAVSGYPSITLPVGRVHGLPVGLSFMGGAWTEGRLVRLAYALEQITKARRAPAFLPTADLTR